MEDGGDTTTTTLMSTTSSDPSKAGFGLETETKTGDSMVVTASTTTTLSQMLPLAGDEVRILSIIDNSPIEDLPEDQNEVRTVGRRGKRRDRRNNRPEISHKLRKTEDGGEIVNNEEGDSKTTATSVDAADSDDEVLAEDEEVPLPPDWVSILHKSNLCLYYHSPSGTCTWSRPYVCLPAVPAVCSCLLVTIEWY